MKTINKKIPADRIAKAFRQLNWNARLGKKTGDYWIFKPESNASDSWAVLPVDIKSADYLFHQDRIIRIFLSIFDYEFNDECYRKIHGYLSKEHYEISNRIELRNPNETSVPYDVFKNLIEKNVLSLRTYCLQNEFDLPLNKLSINHTREGSFVVPLSVEINSEQDSKGEQSSFIEPKEGIIIRSYLNLLGKINISPKTNAKDFADYMIHNNIDSKIVKNILNNSNSLSWARIQSEDKIKEITISGEKNPFVSFNTDENFPTIDFSDVLPVDKEYIETLEIMEAQSDDNNIDHKNVRMRVIIDEMSRDWVKMTVLSINGQKPGNSGRFFKAKLSASAAALPQYDSFAKAMPEAEPIIIHGDVEKLKGRTGEIKLTSLNVENEGQVKLL